MRLRFACCPPVRGAGLSRHNTSHASVLGPVKACSRLATIPKGNADPNIVQSETCLSVLRLRVIRDTFYPNQILGSSRCYRQTRSKVIRRAVSCAKIKIADIYSTVNNKSRGIIFSSPVHVELMCSQCWLYKWCARRRLRRSLLKVREVIELLIVCLRICAVPLTFDNIYPT